MNAFARGLDIPAGSTYCRTATCWSRNERAAAPEEEGRQGLVMELVHEAGRCRCAEREPHHVAARRGRRWRGRDADRLSSKDLNSPFGMALVGNDLYVANTDAVVRFPYKDGATRIDEPRRKVADLPGGPLNHHWTKGWLPSRDGKRLYVAVGSNSNVGENGIEKEDCAPRFWKLTRAAGSRACSPRVAQPGGMAWEPQTVRCGPWSTNAMSSAAISCPITSPR